ncbi:MAG: sigma-70 family RNA polymerase sigma factor [Puniceicoccales bacterium]|jgi:RNA polymerase sigma-70 factor (ECF subfamily)|nr:sigma-70 family RNA polymerase sigma factor [Puniceicoccales bacterium]
MTATEENTLDLARGGDCVAFGTLVTTYQDRIFAKVFSILRNRQDAEEITQDTFIRAQRGLANFRGTASFSTWLYQIATNLARNRYWYWHRRRRDTTNSLDCPIGEEGDMTLQDVLAGDDLSPVHETVNNEFVRRVAECKNQLKDAHREILEMRIDKDMAYEEIAETLGLSIGTVKSRIARAREALRALMGEEFS